MKNIIPALKSAHAVAHAIKLAWALTEDKIIIVNHSRRRGKDVNQVLEFIEENGKSKGADISLPLLIYIRIYQFFFRISFKSSHGITLHLLAHFS